MVAITVVIAGTVFFLVSDIGEDVDTNPPKMQLVSDSATRSDKWVLKVSAAVPAAPIIDFQIIHTTPDRGIVVYDIPSDAGFKGDTHKEILYSVDLAGVTAGSRSGSQTTDPGAGPTVSAIAYRVVFMDVNDDDVFNSVDTFTIEVDTDATAAAYDDRFPKGTHKIELRHIPTAASAGSITGAF